MIMPRASTLAILGFAVVLAAGYCCAARSQPGEVRPNRGQDPKEISGFWTEIYSEYGPKQSFEPLR